MVPLCVLLCHYKHISSHKVFKEFEIGKSTKGWFYGFKLHVICDNKEELVSCKITQGNVDDRVPVLQLAKNISGKSFGDKGYIFQEIFDQLFNQELQCESINNQFNNVFQLEHSHDCNPCNGLINMLALVQQVMTKTP